MGFYVANETKTVARPPRFSGRAPRRAFGASGHLAPRLGAGPTWKTDLPSKNRVWNFFSASRSRIGNFHSQPVETHREKRSTPTKTVLGISLFLSRDPIGEEALLGTGSINLDGLSGQPNSLNANGAQQELINTLKDPDVFEKILKDPIKLRQVINALEEKRGPDCVTQFLKKTILEQTADHPYLFVKNNPVGAIDSLGLFVFPNPFPDIPSVPWPLNMLPPCSGPASGQAGRQDDECSWPAGSFNSNPCLKKCCKDHDDCYTRNGCNMFSWIPGCGSVACKACNAKVAACFAGF